MMVLDRFVRLARTWSAWLDCVHASRRLTSRRHSYLSYRQRARPGPDPRRALSPAVRATLSLRTASPDWPWSDDSCARLCVPHMFRDVTAFDGQPGFQEERKVPQRPRQRKLWSGRPGMVELESRSAQQWPSCRRGIHDSAKEQNATGAAIPNEEKEWAIDPDRGGL